MTLDRWCTIVPFALGERSESGAAMQEPINEAESLRAYLVEIGVKPGRPVSDVARELV